MMMVRRFTLAAATIFLAAAPVSAQSADGGLRLAVAAGPTINDLETGGIDWIFAGGVELRPETWPLVITAEVRYLTIELAEREQFVMPELGFQLQTSFGAFRPFVGVGAGWQFIVRPGDDGSSFATHLATGARIRLASSLDLRLEIRGRSIDPVLALTAGLALSL